MKMVSQKEQIDWRNLGNITSQEWMNSFGVSSYRDALNRINDLQVQIGSTRSSICLASILNENEGAYKSHNRADEAEYSSSGRISSRPDSTETSDINKINQEYRNLLEECSTDFIRNIKRADFEDGIDNEPIIDVRHHISRNKYVTFSWLHSLYSSNQNDPDILAGLLRIIASTTTKDDYNSLLTIVKAGLADMHSKTQEAALMVIEEWRTLQCLDILLTSNTSFASPWITGYAQTLKKELMEEIGDGT